MKMDEILDCLSHLVESEDLATAVNHAAEYDESMDRLREVLDVPVTTDTGIKGFVHDYQRLSDINVALRIFYFRYDPHKTPRGVPRDLWVRVGHHFVCFD